MMIDDAMRWSSFLRGLCALDCQEEVTGLDVCIRNPDGDGPIHGFFPVGAFIPLDEGEFTAFVKALRAEGDPHRHSSCKGVVQTYDFFRFLLTAHQSLPSFINVSPELGRAGVSALRSCKGAAWRDMPSAGPPSATSCVYQAVIDESCLISEFLQELCVVDNGDEVDLGVGRRDPDGGSYTVITVFHPRSPAELRAHISELRKGNPYTRTLVPDESRVQDTYEFFRFVLRAHEDSPTLITISTSLRNVAAFAIENVHEDEEELVEPDFSLQKRVWY